MLRMDSSGVPVDVEITAHTPSFTVQRDYNWKKKEAWNHGTRACFSFSMIHEAIIRPLGPFLLDCWIVFHSEQVTDRKIWEPVNSNLSRDR